MQSCVVKCSTEQEASARHRAHTGSTQQMQHKENRECDTMKEGLEMSLERDYDQRDYDPLQSTGDSEQVSSTWIRSAS
jgi:hypothetical protein